jgi:AraC-like DNA-binding protein
MSLSDRCPNHPSAILALSNRPVEEFSVRRTLGDASSGRTASPKFQSVSFRQGRVESAITPLLPHGRVLMEDVARRLGTSERTLARKLYDESLNFTEILQQLRRNLADRYIDDRKLLDLIVISPPPAMLVSNSR